MGECPLMPKARQKKARMLLCNREHIKPAYAGMRFRRHQPEPAVAPSLETLIGLFVASVGSRRGEKGSVALRRRTLWASRMLDERRCGPCQLSLNTPRKAKRILPASSVIDGNCSRSSLRSFARHLRGGWGHGSTQEGSVMLFFTKQPDENSPT